jgi:glycosyltransferase involved in cell wall biosynthesis
VSPTTGEGGGAPRVSVVIPVYNEDENVIECLTRILEAITLECEVLVVYDTEDDTTLPYLEKYRDQLAGVTPVHNTYGRGPANAIRFGIDQARAPVAVVTMADGSDDPMQIDTLARLVERGVVVAAASRYSRGGQQVGGPAIKGLISRLAGLTLRYFARVGTRDATNSFKAYSVPFVRAAGIESERGFAIGIELVAKARRARLPVAETATIWLDRAFGESSFKVTSWIPQYLRWYFYAFGPKRALPGYQPLRRGDVS